MKTSTHIMLIAGALMAIVVGLDEFGVINIASSPNIAKTAIGVTIVLMIVAFYIWQVKEKYTDN